MPSLLSGTIDGLRTATGGVSPAAPSLFVVQNLPLALAGAAAATAVAVPTAKYFGLAGTEDLPSWTDLAVASVDALSSVPGVPALQRVVTKVSSKIQQQIPMLSRRARMSVDSIKVPKIRLDHPPPSPRPLMSSRTLSALLNAAAVTTGALSAVVDVSVIGLPVGIGLGLASAAMAGASKAVASSKDAQPQARRSILSPLSPLTNVSVEWTSVGSASPPSSASSRRSMR